jgi:CRP-like cAMP-binding protein
VAVTDCRVVPVDAAWFKFLVLQTPFFSLQIMRVMADRLRRTM